MVSSARSIPSKAKVVTPLLGRVRCQTFESGFQGRNRLDPAGERCARSGGFLLSLCGALRRFLCRAALLCLRGFLFGLVGARARSAFERFDDITELAMNRAFLDDRDGLIKEAERLINGEG